MFDYFSSLAKFLGNLQKKWHKTGDFRDLLLESVLFKVVPI